MSESGKFSPDRPRSSRRASIAPGAGTATCSPFSTSPGPNSRDRDRAGPIVARLLDVIEDHEGAEAATPAARVVEAVDHRQPVVETIGQDRGNQRPAGSARSEIAGLAGIRPCRCRRSCRRPWPRSRAPSCPPCRRRHGGRRYSRGTGNIARPWPCAVSTDVGEIAIARMVRRKLAVHWKFHRHPHRHAGRAAVAGRPIGDVLAAPEPALRQLALSCAASEPIRWVKIFRSLRAGKIGAGGRRGNEKLREISPFDAHDRPLRNVMLLWR